MSTFFKVLLTVLIILAALLVILILAMPQLVFHFIFGKPKRSTKVPAYYVDTPHYKVSRPGFKVLKELPHEEPHLTSRDGLDLHAYYFPAETPSKKFMIGIHGYRSYSRPEFGPYVDFYRSRGYNMLLPDDRAHEPSSGKYIGFGVLDRLDCVDWAKYLVKTYGEDIEIFLHGVSMGGATVLAASGEADLPPQVKGITSDCGFSSAWEVLRYELKEVSHLPADYLLPKIEKICMKKAGYNFHDYSAIEQVKKAKVPIFFVQGKKDNMVPPFMAEELYEACASKKYLLMVEEAGHGESIAFAPEKYHEAMITHLGI